MKIENNLIAELDIRSMVSIDGAIAFAFKELAGVM